MKLADYDLDYLVPCGIQNENSDIRVHVCFLTGCISIFARKAALKAIADGKGKDYAARHCQSARITSTGKLVKLCDIEGLETIYMPDDWRAMHGPKRLSSSATAGWVAERAVEKLFPEWRRATPQEDVRGIDFVTPSGQRVQVKYDWKAGPEDRSGLDESKHGSGNVCLEEASINPNRIYSKREA